MPFPPDPIPQTPDEGQAIPAEPADTEEAMLARDRALADWEQELLEQARRPMQAGGLGARLGVSIPRAANSRWSFAPLPTVPEDPWEPLPEVAPEPAPQIIPPVDWEAILNRQRERGGLRRRNANTTEAMAQHQREEAQPVPRTETGQVRLPENNYAMVVHPTSKDYCPYILIAGEWYVLEDAINMGQEGYHPTLRQAPARDVQYFLNPGLSDVTRFEVVYHGAHHRDSQRQREVF